MRNIFLPLLLSLSLLLFKNNAQAQGIVAGVYDAGDVYTDLVPDSVQFAVAAHLSPFPNYDFPIDVDLDGIPDLKISSSGGGGLGGGAAGCGVIPLTQYAQIAAYHDTFQICCPTNVDVLMTARLEFQYTVSEASEYHHDPATIWSDGYGNTTSPIINEWCNIGERYIGFRLCYPFDTLYGWIRVNALNSSNFAFFIKDYACNLNTSNINSPKDITGALLFPNPFGNELKLNISLSYPVQLIVFSTEGKKVIDKTFQEQTSFTTDFLAAGIYYYEMKDNKNAVRRGKLVRQNVKK